MTSTKSDESHLLRNLGESPLDKRYGWNRQNRLDSAQKSVISAFSDLIIGGKNREIIDINLNMRDAQKKIFERIRGFEYSVVIAHRRLGKTTALVSYLFEQAYNAPAQRMNNHTGEVIENEPNFAFISVSINQAQKIAGPMFRKFASLVPGVKYLGTPSPHLKFEHNGATMWLGGAHREVGVRGQGFDGVIFDEYAFMAPTIWESVVRPAMYPTGDQFAIFSSTPDGPNHFEKLYRRAIANPNWGWVFLPNSVTGLLDPNQVKEIQEDYPHSYRQEIECDFRAPVQGNLLGDCVVRAESEKRIQFFPYVPEIKAFTFWDIGWRDDTAIWFGQPVSGGGGVRWFNFIKGTHQHAAEWATRVNKMPYDYEHHLLPHDAHNTSWGTGKTSLQTLSELLKGDVSYIEKPKSRQEVMNKIRKLFPFSQFDETGCREGLDDIALYRRKFSVADNDYSVAHSKAHSHTVDAFGVAAQWILPYLEGGERFSPSVLDPAERREAESRAHLDTMFGVNREGGGAGDDVLDGIIIGS